MGKVRFSILRKHPRLSLGERRRTCTNDQTPVLRENMSGFDPTRTPDPQAPFAEWRGP